VFFERNVYLGYPKMKQGMATSTLQVKHLCLVYTKLGGWFDSFTGVGPGGERNLIYLIKKEIK
jgi:hypothetical protein